MTFDSNRAWREASAAASANRDVLLAVAGVFFLLPGLASIFFLSDFQADMMANIGNPEASQRLMAEMTGPVVGVGLFSFAFQSVGYLAMLALLTDRTRPTVGQAILTAIKALPSVIGAMLLFAIGYMMAIIFVAMLAAPLRAMGGLAGVLVLLFALIVGGAAYTAVRFSLVLPVIAIENVRNPVAAMMRSWSLTRGNSLRLFGFYLILMIVYLILLLVVSMVAVLILSLVAGQGKITMLVSGVVSGAVGAAASVLLTAILAAIHRQLAGPSKEAIGATFD